MEDAIPCRDLALAGTGRVAFEFGRSQPSEGSGLHHSHERDFWPWWLSSCLDTAASRLGVSRLTALQLTPAISPRSYDSNLNVSRDDKKNKFASTMEFVEDYLNNVVSEAVPFANEEKNKLTFEVRDCPCPWRVWLQLPLERGWPRRHPSPVHPAQPPQARRGLELPCPSPGCQPCPQPHLLRLLQLQ